MCHLNIHNFSSSALKSLDSSLFSSTTSAKWIFKFTVKLAHFNWRSCWEQKHQVQLKSIGSHTLRKIQNSPHLIASSSAALSGDFDVDDDNRWKERGENDEILVLQQQTAIVDYRDSASYLKLIQRLVNSEKFVLLPAARNVRRKFMIARMNNPFECWTNFPEKN